MKYYKCSKCGDKITTEDKLNGLMCTSPMYFRTSGICGGSFIEEITKEEFYKNLDKWK